MKVKKDVKVKPKYIREVTVELNGKEFPIELNATPYRLKDEDYDTYRERLKWNEHFLKMAKKEYVFKNLTYLERILGKKGKIAIKDANGNFVELKKEENGSNTDTDGNAPDEGHDSDTAGNS